MARNRRDQEPTDYTALTFVTAALIILLLLIASSL